MRLLRNRRAAHTARNLPKPQQPPKAAPRPPPGQPPMHRREPRTPSRKPGRHDRPKRPSGRNSLVGVTYLSGKDQHQADLREEGLAPYCLDSVPGALMSKRKPSAPQFQQVSRIREGLPFPLGATWDGLGVNFAIFSAHATKVELCLFDASGETEQERIELPEYTDEIWHGYLPDAHPGQIYGYRVH